MLAWGREQEMFYMLLVTITIPTLGDVWAASLAAGAVTSELSVYTTRVSAPVLLLLRH